MYSFLRNQWRYIQKNRIKSRKEKRKDFEAQEKRI